ncbi:DNA repair protein RecO [Patescibacteria group bacterium]
MKGYRTKAFVLRKFDLKEADQIITLYTEQEGKVKTIAKGIRKAQSKNIGNLELLNLIDVLLVPGKSFEIVTQVKVENSFLSLKEDLDYLAFVYYVVELLDKLIVENEKNEYIFDLLKDFLNWIKVKEKNPFDSFGLRIFELKLISLLGFAPEIFRCVKCSKKLVSGGKKYFDVSLGGIVCNDCKNGGEQSIPISENSIKVMRLILEDRSFESLSKIKISLEDKEMVMKAIRDYLLWILEKQLKSLEVINAFKKV